MLDVINGYGNNLKYNNLLIKKFKKKSVHSELCHISHKETIEKQKTTTRIYFNSIERNIFNLKNCIIWYENKLSKGIYEYCFGLNSENNLKILSKDHINFKENFSLKINYDDIIESQFVFAKNSETSEICLLIKLNLSNLSESELDHFITKYDLFQSNDNIKNCYFLNLGVFDVEDTVYNFFSFISEVRVIDNSKPYLKIVSTKNKNSEFNESEKEFIETLNEFFDEDSFSEDITNDKINPFVKKKDETNTHSKNQTNKTQDKTKPKTKQKRNKSIKQPSEKTTPSIQKTNPPIFTNLENEEIYAENYSQKRHDLIILGKKVCDSKILLADLAGVTVKDIDIWYQKGYEGKKPFNRFYIEYIDAAEYYENNKNNMGQEDDFNSINKYRLKIFNAAIKEGKTKKFACKLANFNMKTVEDWIYKGNHRIKPYVDFIDEYHRANEYAMKKAADIPNNVKIQVIALIKSGKTLNQAAKSINKGIYSSDIIYNYNKGKNGDEYYYKFYHDCETAREGYLKAIKFSEETDESYSIPTAVDFEELDDSFERPYDPEFDNIENFIYFSNSGANPENSYKANRKFKENRPKNHKPHLSEDKTPLKKSKPHFTKDKFPLIKNKLHFTDANVQIKLKLFNLYIEEGKTIKEASKLSDLYLEDVNEWISKGSLGIKLYSNFYKKYEDAKKFYIEKENKNKEKIQSEIIRLIKKGKSIESAINLARKNIPESTVLNWYAEGSKGNEKYIDFYKKCNEAIEYYESKHGKHEKDLKEQNYFLSEEVQNKLKIYISNIKDGKNKKEASKISKLNYDETNKWLSRGYSKKEPYITFYKEYAEAKKSAIEKENKYKEEIQSEIIKLIKNGKTINESINMARKDLSETTIRNWYNYGRKGNGKYIDFYNKCNEAKEFYELSNYLQKLQYETKIYKIEKDSSEFIIRTRINNKYLINFFTKLNGYEKYIFKIISTAISDETMSVIIKFKIKNSDISIIENLFKD